MTTAITHARSSADLGAIERRWLLVRSKLGRLRRWEFWPTWAIYAPMIPWLSALALRHGLTCATATNPAMPLSGIVGEFKHDILRHLPPEVTLPARLIDPASADQRIAQLDAIMAEQTWSWPIVLKPDAGERGSGVRLIHSRNQAIAYLTSHRAPLIAQKFHPGPYEIGLFYVRLPSWKRGRIFSITDKRFSSVVGDGSQSIESLILRNPRLRLQASVFLERLGPRAASIPSAGERVSLGFAGNHCQGTMFVDGAHLITRPLTLAIDRVAKAYPGFYFGRFDLRYTDPDELAQGRGFAIVELNGLTSESTNIYTPGWSFWRGQRVLRRQWGYAFAIARENIARGHKPATLAELWRCVRSRPSAN
jgi:hypothetical protein